MASTTETASSAAHAAAVAQHFAELFPPLVTSEPSSLECDLESADGPLDLSVDELVLRPLEQQVESHLYEALQRWNRYTPATGEATLPYMQRLKKYRAVGRWMLYENEDPHADDEGSVVAAATQKNPSPNARRRLAKQQQKTRRAEIANFKEIFGLLPPITALRELRRPSARLERFVERFPPKKRVLLTKRSVAETQTSMCFEFARRTPPSRIDRLAEDAAKDENAAPGGLLPPQTNELQRPTATTAATWRSRTLLASMEDHEQRTTENTSQPATTYSDNDELVLWIDVLHSSKDPARTQSFLVLGSHTIADLLDLVVCAYDQRFETHARQAKMLYFDKQFYVDRRCEQNADYSSEILTWIHAKPSRVAKYLKPDATSPAMAKSLETTTFAQLALKPDMPGVFIHQGECEHLVRLRDVRLLDPAIDSTNKGDDFPMRLPNPLNRQLRSCLVCSNYSAKFVCYGDRMGSADPMFYCERCFRAAHYDRDGRLLFSDFQAFPYIQE